MNQLQEWTLDTIRNDDPMMSWLEERRFDFVPPTQSSIEQMMQGATVVLITDNERAWFGNYILQNMNAPSQTRPLLPIVNIDSLYPHFNLTRGAEGLDMLEDMLSLSYGENYFFWYVGKGDDSRADIAKRNDKSMLWVLDEEVQNAFMLHSFDKLLDIKLLHLYRLFDKTLSSALFGEIEL